MRRRKKERKEKKELDTCDYDKLKKPNVLIKS